MNKIKVLSLSAFVLLLPILVFAQVSVPLGLQKVETRLHLGEKVPSILLDAAFTKGGRGDTAPVYIAARNLRKMGYVGKIQVVLNDVKAHLALRELSLDYRLKSDAITASILIEDEIEIIRSFGEFHPQYVKPEIGIRFALRPLEIKTANQIKGAGTSFFLGVNNLSQLKTSGGVQNKVVVNSGESAHAMNLPDVGFGEGDIGFYYNRLAADIGTLPEESKRLALLRQLAIDRDSYLKLSEAGKNKLWMDKFAARNDALVDFFKSNMDSGPSAVKIASVYGVGMSATWADFSSYVNALPKDQPVVLFSPTVFESKTQEFFKKAQSNFSFKMIDLTNGEAIPKNLKPGDVVFVQTGNFPHETFLHLNSISDLPNVVAGDNAIADMISMGKPFVCTTVDWNVASTEGVGEYLSQVARKNGFSEQAVAKVKQIYLKSESDRFKNLAELMNSKEWKNIFVAARTHAERHDVLEHLLQVHEGKNATDLTGQHLASLKGEGLPSEAEWRRAYQLIDDEQTKNIKNIYKQGVFDSEMNMKYSADRRAVFKVGYYLIPEGSTAVEEFQAKNISKSVSDFFQAVVDGKKMTVFPVHPEAEKMYALTFGNEFQYVAPQESKLVFIPSASERSGWIVDLTKKEKAPTVWAKLSIPVKINDTNRALHPTEIERGVVMSGLISDSEKSTLQVIPEPFGVYPKSKGQTIGGFLARDMEKVLGSDKHRWMGVMSFLAEDPATHEPYFFRFMNLEERKNPEKWLKSNIFDPLSSVVTEYFFNRGSTLEMHSQNLMIAVDENGVVLPKKFAYRDLGGWSLDFKQMAANGELQAFALRQPFEDVFAFKFSEAQPVQTVQRFLKLQMTDLFAIQMKAYGLIDRDQREAMKSNFEKLWKGLLLDKMKARDPRCTLTADSPWTDIYNSWEGAWTKQVVSKGSFKIEQLNAFKKANSGRMMMYKGREASEAVSIMVNREKKDMPYYLLNVEGQIIGTYIPKDCSKNFKKRKFTFNWFEPVFAGAYA